MTVPDKKLQSIFIREKGTGKNKMRKIMLLVIMLVASRDGSAQEEHHKHEHRHLEYAKTENPIVMTEKSIAQGGKLFEKHCMACHGEAGKGGIGTDLSGTVRIHGNTDGEMFHVIKDGVAGTAMKGFRKELSDEMRWHLVNYITSLRKNETNK